MPDQIPDPSGDPFDRLRSLSRSGRPMPALPAEEVRRRGDRRRRRARAMAAAATLVVVGVVGTGGVALGDMLADRDEPGPADSPTPAPSVASDVRTDVPEDFPLEAGLEVVPGGARDDELDATAFYACDEQVGLVSADGVVDWASTIAKADGEPLAYARSVATFADADAATAFVDDVRTTLARCPFAGGEAHEASSMDDVVAGEPEAAAPLDETFQVQSYATDGPEDALEFGAGSVRFYRVANAVLVSSNWDASAGPSDLDALTSDGFELDVPTVLAMRYYAGQDLPSYSGADPVDPDGGDEGGTTGPEVTVAPGQLLTTADLPAPPERSDPWAKIEPSDEPTLACEPQALQVLGFANAAYAEFTAPITEQPGTTPDPDVPELRDSAINSAVLAFDSREEADAAYDTVTSWISACDAPVRGQDITVEDREPTIVVPDGAEGYWWATSYLAPEACPEDDCDAAWFDHQGAALVGTYVVLVSYRDLAGPLELEGMDDRMDAIFTAAVQKAAYGLEG
ncbi:hypothetical protein QE364_000450 [Nocardioides zeae]|uniref:Uncharacterized protein n=1 Tax=Nocardioides zeae TaxID=1457234 RepID=A0ACC6IE39_9ACTN|nr:hypothetical protein [Nocardioides zeae]MDR6175834.1 hypothetical protein [Nocardioides zeae]MDR6208762.1 hypothetical protein [Nocardioides zeae]